MQAPASSSSSSLLNAAQDLPSPDSDQDFVNTPNTIFNTTPVPATSTTIKGKAVSSTTTTTALGMVTLPSSPSLFTGSPSNNADNNNNITTTPCPPAILQLPTPATPVTPTTPSKDDEEPLTNQLNEQQQQQQQLTPMVVPAKRGYKSHVPSACVNCKKAHLACDVSRPCKRCVSAGKADSCQDVKHKKRGRPRLHDTKRLGNTYSGSMVLDDNNKNGMYGMIQTPTFTVATSVIHRDHPKPQTTNISFVHEPIEAFREQDEQRHRRKDSNAGSQSQQALRDPEPPPAKLSQPSLSNLSPLLDPKTASPSSQPCPPHQGQMRLSCEPSCPTTTLNDAATNHQQCTVATLPPPSAPRITITLFLSMEMCCARASDEVTDLWGYHPQDLLHRSLYEMISSHDTDRLGRLHRLLLDNIMDVARQHDRSIGPDVRPPPAERTSSPLFYETDPEKLVITAKGSSTFSDTIHIKKHSDEHELYEVLVYLGGGLGADLSVPASLNRLYIVAELRKHEYKVQTSTSSMSQAALPVSLSFDRTRLFSPFVHSSPTTITTSSSTTKASPSPSRPSINNSNGSSSSSASASNNNINNNNSNNINKQPSRAYSFGRLGSGGLLQARQGSLPNHFAANSQLNTVSLPGRKLDIPKINIAPMTGNKKRSLAMNGAPYFRPIAAATAKGSTTIATATTTSNSHGNNSSGPLPPVARESTNPYSTLAYRFAPITSSSSIGGHSTGNGSNTSHSGGGIRKSVGSPRTGSPSYTHPTTQYFLQTSSSTLNAAASAAQSSSRPVIHNNMGLDTTMANNDKAVGKTDSNRKAEMSIRSLLC